MVSIRKEVILILLFTTRDTCPETARRFSRESGLVADAYATPSKTRLCTQQIPT